MNHVIMYQPIDRELLEDLFQSAFVAQSFKDLGNLSYSIELPDRDMPRLKKFNIAYTTIRRADIQNVKDKFTKTGNPIF